MTRNVRAILIGAPKTAGADEVQEAPIAVATISNLLAQRFPGAATIVELVDTDATHAKVVKALETARDTASDGELFVLLFAGHGTKATDETPFQSWALKGNDRFTDVELAQHLLKFEPKVDTVVISACCYGAGLFKPGPFIGHHPPPVPPADFNTAIRLRLFNQQRVAVLKTTFAAKNAPMVCISAAEREGEVKASNLDAFADVIKAAAEAEQTYQDLENQFENDKAAGRLYQVDARPSARMSRVILATQ